MYILRFAYPHTIIILLHANIILCAATNQSIIILQLANLNKINIIIKSTDHSQNDDDDKNE